ncbi:MAG: phosphoribosyltransferase [Candidatus Levybacteria bacterium]|nr:phosphoribosyltransferase [Candidatus Levybacteria bacterium]
MFRDRQEAGELLALKLKKIIKGKDFVVIPLLRGGIVLGKKISDYFHIPLLPLSVKKIGAPLNRELAIGAVTIDKTYYVHQDIIKHLDVDKNYLKDSLDDKWKEAKIMHKKFNKGRKISLQEKKVIIVDDGIATGATAICAAKYARYKKAREIILATPVIAKDSLRIIKMYFDRVIFLEIPSRLVSVSQFYSYFPQVDDREVVKILNIKNKKYS